MELDMPIVETRGVPCTADELLFSLAERLPVPSGPAVNVELIERVPDAESTLLVLL